MMKKQILPQFKLILGLFKVTLMIVLGIYIWWSSSFDYLPKYFRTIFAIAIVAYGFFRLVTIILKFNKQEV